MEKFVQFMEKYLQPLGVKAAGNRYLRAISDGFMFLMPVILIGSIFSLLASLPIPAYLTFLKSTGIGNVLSIVSAMSMGIMALVTAFAITYYFVAPEIKDNATPAIIALICFLIIIPLGAAKDGLFIPTAFLGAAGLFTAIIVSLVVGILYCTLIRKQIFIRLPDSVPPFVQNAFKALIPAFVIIILFAVIKGLFMMTSFGSFPQFIYSIVQKPIMHLGANIWTLVILTIIMQAFWMIGVHGGNIVVPVLFTVFLALDMENMHAFQLGQALPHLIGMAFFFIYSTEGGCGATMGLNIDMLLFSKSERYKSFGKLTLPTSIFGVNEPIIFGTPIIMNPIMAIPFILGPCLLLLNAYLWTTIGIIPPLVGAGINFALPRFVMAMYQGGFMITVLALFNTLLSAVIYYPFFKIMDHQACMEEQKAA